VKKVESGKVDAPETLALAKSKNCLSCHAVDKKVVGPAFTDVSKKFKGNSAAEAELTQKILHGSSGAWGPVPMPANSDVTPAQAKQLAAWVLSGAPAK
jgi:cytochrome c